MTSTLGRKWVCGIIVVLLSVIGTSYAIAADYSLIVGTNSHAIQLNNPYKTVKIQNPQIVDVIPQTDHSFLLRPLSVGLTDVNVLDDQDKTIRNFSVVVQDFVKIMDPKSLYKYESYLCGPNGCEIHK